MVLRAHRVPGMVEADVPTMAQVLRMATVGGARTTPYGDSIGTLEVGKAADMVLIDWDKRRLSLSRRDDADARCRGAAGQAARPSP